MEVSAFKHPAGTGVPARIAGRSPLLRLQSDERLVALTRRGSHGAYEALVGRYQPRLFAFCRHMVGSREDAEDVLQEVFTAAFNALHADERAINVRPWLYRIARNRCLNHLRRATAVGVDSMDIHFADHGQSTADRVAGREEFRLLLADVAGLPESQRTALLLREIDALSYDQIAEAMETTVPSVKSLLVRARVGLAEAAEARLLSCEEVRLELGGWAEGLAKPSPAVRRHVRTCTTCAAFRTHLKHNNRALAAVLPLGPLVLLKKLAFFSLGSHAAGSGGGAAGTGAALGLAGAGASGASGGLLSASVSALAAKAAAGLAAAAIVTAGTIEVDSASRHRSHSQRPTLAAVTPAPAPAHATATSPHVAGASTAASNGAHRHSRQHARPAAHHHAVKPDAVPVKEPAPAVVPPVAAPAPKPTPAPVQSVSASTTLPAQAPPCPGPTAATGKTPAGASTTSESCPPAQPTAPTAPPTVTTPPPVTTPTPPPPTTTPPPPSTTPPPPPPAATPAP